MIKVMMKAGETGKTSLPTQHLLLDTFSSLCDSLFQCPFIKGLQGHPFPNFYNIQVQIHNQMCGRV